MLNRRRTVTDLELQHVCKPFCGRMIEDVEFRLLAVTDGLVGVEVERGANAGRADPCLRAPSHPKEEASNCLETITSHIWRYRQPRGC